VAVRGVGREGRGERKEGARVQCIIIGAGIRAQHGNVL
jgi:hypothetical protein